jgi:uroporphyrinogen decarboxylase
VDHWKRIEAAMRGGWADRPPIALWRHFPQDDQSADRLVAHTLRWQRRWNFDLVKFMPSGTYGVEDWGAVSAYQGSVNGAREVVTPGIRRVEDWAALPALDTRRGVYGVQNDALAIVTHELGGRVPVLQTVFSPLTTARKLAGERLFADLRRAPEMVEQGLATITEVTIRFAREAIARGAHGIFFATQLASHRLLTHDEYARFGRPFDLRVLEAVGDTARLNMLHVHGMDVMFDAVAHYPAGMINWHDRLTEPGLRDAASGFRGLLVGGLDENDTLLGPPQAIERQVHEALEQVPDGRLLLAPGCVMRIDTPDESINAVFAAAESFRSATA